MAKRLVLIAGLLSLSGSLVYSQTFSGRLTTAFYAFQRSDTVGANSNQGRGYQAFQFDFGGRDLTLRSYGQLDTDFSNRLAGDGKARMYNLYLHWRNIGKRAEAKLGRQALFSGAAVGTIDGLWLQARVAKWLRLKAFGGALMPADQKVKIQDDIDSNYLLGGQVLFDPTADLNLGASYYKKNEQRPQYAAIRSDSVGNVFTQSVHPSDRAYEFASLDASWSANRNTYLYGRTDFDVISSQFTRAELALRSAVTSKLTLSGSYIFRSPLLPWNSLLAYFNVEDNQEGEFGAFYQVKPGVRIFTNVAGIFYSGDESFRFTLGFDGSYGSLNYVNRSGYAGELDGLNAALYYPLQQGKYLPSLQLSWASYALDKNASDRQSLFSGALGILFRPASVLTLDSQLQLLHNKYYSNDMRFMFRLQYWFFSKRQASL